MNCTDNETLGVAVNPAAIEEAARALADAFGVSAREAAQWWDNGGAEEIRAALAAVGMGVPASGINATRGET